MAYLHQSPNGVGISSKQWESLKNDPSWTVREYRNDKLWLRFHWVGRYDKSLPAEYRHSHAVTVYNRLITKASEWEEETIVDKSWVIDQAASETFRTKSTAEAHFEDLLLRYTESFIDVDEDGEVVFVEEGNKLAPVVPGSSMLVDEEQIAAAAAAGVDLGGWS